MLLWILNTSRTFNGYDVGKIFLYGMILAMILYYFSICGMLMRYWSPSDDTKSSRTEDSENSEPYRDRQKRFYNNLNYEAGRRYYSRPDVIDYDVIDYTDLQEHEENGRLWVRVELQVRLVYLRNGKISSEYQRIP